MILSYFVAYCECRKKACAILITTTKKVMDRTGGHLLVREIIASFKSITSRTFEVNKACFWYRKNSVAT
jgi:hypothetical protein